VPSLPPAITLSSVALGGGPLVVGLHDLGKTGASMREALAPLTGEHRLVVPDLRGHGASPTPKGPWSIDDFSSDAARIVAAEGGSAIVVGAGLGAATALALTLGHPHLVRGLVLTGIGPKAEDQDRHDRWVRVARALREELDAEGMALAAEAFGSRPDWRGALSQVAAPVTVVAGADDGVARVAAQRQLAVWIPGARRRVVKNAGHDVPAERSDELVAAVRAMAAPDHGEHAIAA
jgi:3-oxoadipate enol-lactonase